MKSIFALFEDFDNAQQAVQALLQDGFEEEHMNVIVRAGVGKDWLRDNLEHADLHRVDIRKSEEVGHKSARGLVALLGGEQGVPLPGIGDVLAGGELATQIAQNASATWAPEKGFKDILGELNVPDGVADAYHAGINEGGVLFWIRTADDRAAAAANHLRAEAGKHVADYAGNAPLS
ncbi:MAG: hypothetical protein R3272_05890 [Candidatus Promineifilaceae bacterium]|nr:hypothetical protein [Candidatus Promineifilaceae bacterium]